MSDNIRVGRVLRASTRGFDCGTHSRDIGAQHDFGAFVKAPIANTDAQEGLIHAVGVIYKVEIKDDQLINELVLGDAVPDMVLRDQRENRMIPVEIKVINIGYQRGDHLYHTLPARPPMSLSDVSLMLPDEVKRFTALPTFLRLMLNASEVPSDDLIASAIRYVALEAYPDDGERYDFHVRCGKQLAKDIGDLKRLSHLLNLVRP